MFYGYGVKTPARFVYNVSFDKQALPPQAVSIDYGAVSGISGRFGSTSNNLLHVKRYVQNLVRPVAFAIGACFNGRCVGLQTMAMEQLLFAARSAAIHTSGSWCRLVSDQP